MNNRQAFEGWCETILKDNPNWRESGDAELGWQAWQAATDAALERAAREVEKIDKENWFAWQCAFSEHSAKAIRALKDTVTTDKEMLELAAKACGWKYHGPHQLDSRRAVGGWIDPHNGDTYWEDCWNPLTDDGDALQLAVKLDFGVEVMLSLGETRCGNGDQEIVTERHGNDPYAATRRAIVRAAAEIGKTMS